MALPEGFYRDELGRLTNFPPEKHQPLRKNVRKSQAVAPVVRGTIDPEMRALSIRQPWAEQILRGEKKIEYRTVACTNMIGKRVYLYASARKDQGEQDECLYMGLKHSDLPSGVIVGTMEISKCEGRKGDYEWHIRRPKRFKEPMKPENKPQPVWFRPFT